MKPVAGGRQASIDVLRAVAIVLMVVVHFVENLSGWHGEADNVFEGVHRVWWLPTGFAAPIFTFLTGVSYRLWLDLQWRKGHSDEAIAKGTIRRGLFLVGLGLAFNVFVWLPEDVFNWDILTLIGCGLLALEAARRMPDGVVLFAAGLVAAVAPAMREVAGYAEYWSQGYFDYDFTVADVTLGWLVTGYFPVFPWLAYPLVGYALAPRLVGQTPTTPVGQACSLPSPVGQACSLPSPVGQACSLPKTGCQPRSLPGLTLGAGLVAAAGLLVVTWPWLPAAVTAGNPQAWTMFPASAAYVLGTLGTVIGALAVLHGLLDGDEPRFAGLVAWAAPLSRHSLSLYLLHHVVHIWPLWAAGLVTEGDATALWQVAMPPAASLALAAVFLVMAAVICCWADRRRLPTAEALMRWLCD